MVSHFFMSISHPLSTYFTTKLCPESVSWIISIIRLLQTPMFFFSRKTSKGKSYDTTICKSIAYLQGGYKFFMQWLLFKHLILCKNGLTNFYRSVSGSHCLHIHTCHDEARLTKLSASRMYIFFFLL